MKVILCSLIGLFVLAYFYDIIGKDRGEASHEGALYGLKKAIQSETEAQKEHTDVIRTANAQRHEEAAIWLHENVELELEREKYLREAEETVGLAKKAVSETALWQSKVVPLLSNGKGRTLARSDVLLAAFARIYAANHPEPWRAEFIYSHADKLYRGFKKGDFQKIEDVSELEEDPFLAWRKQAVEIQASYHAARMQIEGLLMAAEALAPTDADAHSLQVHLDDLERRTAVQLIVPMALLPQASASMQGDTRR